jgi:RNA-directed DNA polymerase
LGKKASPQWILEGDIKACFDQISHDWLLENIPIDKVILQKWLKAGFMEKGVLHPTEEGTPQGGIISPTLANMTLDGLESLLRKEWPRYKAGISPKVNFVRYADDFIVTGATKEILEEGVLPLIEAFFKERGLTLSKEKTKITHIEDGFDFLGQNVRKYKGVLIIKPAKKNVQAFLAKVREVIKSHKTATAGNLIGQLNPMIRGWANYHQHVCSKQTLGTVDNVIFETLWRWAVRRHPYKGKRWVKQKYFRHFRNRNWVFTGEGTSNSGKDKLLHLLYAKETPIRRHVKIRGEANPYDPQWEEYFEHRIHVQMENDLKGHFKLLNLWKSQDGWCPICQQKITKTTGWHLHHIVWRSQGGGDEASNLVLLHPNCHRKVHSRNLTVVKPCPAKGITKA